MEVRTERNDGVLSAHVSGRVDSTNAREFEEAIRSVIEDNDRAVILDFEKLVYISSAGLRAVLMTAKNLWQRDAAFALCSMSEIVREVFEVSGFDKIITIHSSKDEALASLND